MSYTTDASRWRALTTRDPLAATAFVYTVKSTRIYCRPTCPARLARRANVGFCSSSAEASALGFRPCKRCKPDAAATEDPQEKAVEKACALIKEAVKSGEEGEGLRLQVLAKKVGLTPRYFHKIFKERMGVTPREWARGKMGGDGEGESAGEMRTPSLVHSPPEMEELDLDAFDFSELVDFEGAAESTGDTVAMGAMIAPFGEPFDMTASMCGWEAFAPDYLGEGFRLDHTTPNVSGAMKTSATFEQDAALIMDMANSQHLAEMLYGDALNDRLFK